MGAPKEVTSISGALQELISAYSALDMPQAPMVREDQTLDTQINNDFWIHHSSLHIEKVIAFLHSINKPVDQTEPKNFYFTFGLGDSVNSGKFIKFAAHNWVYAREKMIERFKNQWAFQYTEEEWFKAGIPQDRIYGYKEIF